MTRVGWRTVCCVSLEYLALGVWVGGLIVLVGAVIPAVFNTFGGQESGGLFLTKAFEGYNRLVVVALIILISAMAYRQWVAEPVARVSRTEWLLLSAMGGIAGVIILVLHPQAAALQAEAFGLRDEQAKKAAFEAFFRLHKPIRSLYVVNVILGTWLLVLKAKRSWQDEGIPA
ncbi:MAG TPA: DUF4149 domain-containing protein [Nitrospira sp.]|nr:DUF4149 domain-containing protein [Nitrospira sp.]